MTMRLAEEHSAKPLAIHVSGRLVKADYEQLVLAVERLFRQPGKQRLLSDKTRSQCWQAGAALRS